MLLKTVERPEPVLLFSSCILVLITQRGLVRHEDMRPAEAAERMWTSSVLGGRVRLRFFFIVEYVPKYMARLGATPINDKLFP